MEILNVINTEFTVSLSQLLYGVVAIGLVLTLSYQTGYNRATQVVQQEAVRAGVAKWQTVDSSPKTTFMYHSIAPQSPESANTDN